MIVPMDAPVKIAAFTAVDNLRKAVVAGKITPFPRRAGMNNAAADQLGLDLHKNIFGNNGLVVIFYIVLGNDAAILDARFCQKISCISFL